jgi:predicted nucleic acid-binding protein
MKSRSGVVLDTTILIAAERRRESIRYLLNKVREACGETVATISTVTVVELTHGIHRAKTEQDRVRRRVFSEDAFSGLIVHPLTLEIAQLAGQIEGEQAARGIGIPFEDLLIGATALHLGFEVLTHNTKHFQLIPGLAVRSL